MRTKNIHFLFAIGVSPTETTGNGKQLSIKNNPPENPEIPTQDSDGNFGEQMANKDRADESNEESKANKTSSCSGCCGRYCRLHCINCHQTFEKKSMGYRRNGISVALTTPSEMSVETFLESVIGYKVPESFKRAQFVCLRCYTLFSQLQRAREAYTRALSDLKQSTSKHSHIYPHLKARLNQLVDGSSKLLPVFSELYVDNLSKQTASPINASSATSIDIVTGNEDDNQSEKSRLAQEMEFEKQTEKSQTNGNRSGIKALVKEPQSEKNTVIDSQSVGKQSWLTRKMESFNKKLIKKYHGEPTDKVGTSVSVVSISFFPC